MKLQDLVNETLVEKNRRLRRAKCPHEEIYSSTVGGRFGVFTQTFCLDCGLSFPRIPQATEAPHE